MSDWFGNDCLDCRKSRKQEPASSIILPACFRMMVHVDWLYYFFCPWILERTRNKLIWKLDYSIFLRFSDLCFNFDLGKKEFRNIFNVCQVLFKSAILLRKLCLVDYQMYTVVALNWELMEIASWPNLCHPYSSILEIWKAIRSTFSKQPSISFQG